VPRILEGKAEQAVKDFAAATAKHDVRSEFMAKAKS
jgi:molecular chaperone DnaJ